MVGAVAASENDGAAASEDDGAVAAGRARAGAAGAVSKARFIASRHELVRTSIVSALIADCLRGCRAGLAARAAGSCCRSAIPGLAAGAAVRPDIASPAAIALVCEISMSGRRVYQPSETTLTKHTRPEAVPSKYGSVIMNTHRAQWECGFTHYFTTERNGRFLNSTSTSPRIQARRPPCFCFCPLWPRRPWIRSSILQRKEAVLRVAAYATRGRKPARMSNFMATRKPKYAVRLVRGFGGRVRSGA